MISYPKANVMRKYSRISIAVLKDSDETLFGTRYERV
jgi:hypothetical protein